MEDRAPPSPSPTCDENASLVCLKRVPGVLFTLKRDARGRLQLPDLPLQVLQHPPDALEPDDLPPRSGQGGVRHWGPADPQHVVNVTRQQRHVTCRPPTELLLPPLSCDPLFLFSLFYKKLFLNLPVPILLIKQLLSFLLSLVCLLLGS